MLKLESSKMQNAIKKAKQMKPRVKMTGERVYSVSGSRGNTYTVTFSVAGGLKLGACTCPAGEAGQMCYHIAAAAALNIAIQTMRKAAQVAASAPAKSTSQNETLNTDERAQLITDVKAAWHRARPFESIALKLYRLFDVMKLEDVSTEDLRKVLAALTPGNAAKSNGYNFPLIARPARRSAIPYHQALDACARGRGSLMKLYGLAVRAGITPEQAEAELNARRAHH